MIVAVALSGGADSLRAAWILKRTGHDVQAVHMRVLPSSTTGLWNASEEIEKRETLVRELARKLDVPLTVVDLRDEFDRQVVRPFVEAYRCGITPNPCVLCNPAIKFGLFMEKSLALGADRFATGHYVQKVDPSDNNGRFGLRRSPDSAKDQSYFLCGLTQAQLARTLFPLGKETKHSTNQWLRKAGFSRWISEESQEICFIPAGNYREFLVERLGRNTPPPGGPIVDLTGKVVGRHKGIFNYTVGQRRGLNVPSTAPYYVVAIDPERNIVWVGRSDDLWTREMIVGLVNWVSIDAPSNPREALVRIRNQHRPAPAQVVPLAKNKVLVRFHAPQRAVTPGQAAVFYENDLLLGGGRIEKTDLKIPRTYEAGTEHTS